MIYGTLQNTPLNRSSQPTDYTELVEACHALLLRFDAPLPVLKTPAIPLDRTRQQHSPYFLITPRIVTLLADTVCLLFLNNEVKGSLIILRTLIDLFIVRKYVRSATVP